MQYQTNGFIRPDDLTPWLRKAIHPIQFVQWAWTMLCRHSQYSFIRLFLCQWAWWMYVPGTGSGPTLDPCRLMLLTFTYIWQVSHFVKNIPVVSSRAELAFCCCWGLSGNLWHAAAWESGSSLRVQSSGLELTCVAPDACISLQSEPSCRNLSCRSMSPSAQGTGN